MLELHTFGGLELRTEDGERVEALAGRTKCLALLAYLAVEAPEGRVPREQVAALLWPDRTDELSRNSLRSALSQIRQATDPVVLAGKGTSTLGLIRDHLRADVTAFREALEAGEEEGVLELYKGDFLAGVRVEGARPFRRWADRKRGQLRQQAYEAALSVGTSAREAGDLASAEAAFRQALDLAPLREEAAAKLIRTLAERGRPADALQLYETFRERRETELEMAPSDQLQKMVDKLKRAPPPASGAGAEKPAVEDAPPEPVGSSAEELEAGPTPTSDSPSGGEPSRRGRYRRRTLLVALVAVGLLGGLLAGAWHLLGIAGGGSAAEGVGDRSVAVLPFEAIGTEDPVPIAAGLHSDLLTRLSTVGDLAVTSATSVERYRETDLPLPAIADSLDVKWIVEGEVQQADGAIQVNAQLVDARTDTHAWADTYRRELTAENLFDLQAELSARITRSLQAELTPEEQQPIERIPTADLEAYRLYAHGRGLLARRTDSAMRRAEDLFRLAIRRDSTFPPAWAALSKALVSYPQWRGRDPDSVFPLGRKAARRALELDPDLAEAHIALAVVDFYRMRGPEALRRNRRALELDPSNAMAHHGLNLLHLVFGRPEEALEHARRAVALGPMSPQHHRGLALASLARDDHERGLRATRRAREIEPDYGDPDLEHYALYRLGELPPMERAEGMGGGPLLAVLAEATSGDTTRARDLLSTLEEERDVPPNLRTGLLHAALGHRAEAIDIFEAASRRREKEMSSGGLTIALRYYYPDVLGPLRTGRRWNELIREINVGWGLNPDGSLPDSADVSFEGHPDD